MAGQAFRASRERDKSTRSAASAHVHRLAPVCLLALGLFGIVEARKLGLGSLTDPGPGLWPLVVASIVVASAAILLVVDNRADYEAWSGRSARILGGVAGMAVYIVAFSYLGVAIATALLLAVWLRVFAGESWRSTIVLTVAGTAALYLIFAVLLNVPFPEGILVGGAA